MDYMTKPQRYILVPSWNAFFILDTVENKYVEEKGAPRDWQSKRRASNRMRELEKRWQAA